jgi:hypothetical protein
VADEIYAKDEKGRFVSGNIGGGRQPGTRNKLGEQFVSDLQEHWQTHGKAALDGCLVESPAQYCRVVASLLPKQAELKVINPLEGVSDDDIAVGLAAIRAARKAGTDGTVVTRRAKPKASPEKPDLVH